MKRILILVEGQTEETFVRDVLVPYFLTRELALSPKLVVTRRVAAGGHDKGGFTRYKHVKDDLVRLLADTGAERVTTMLDYYGLPEDFPGLANRPAGDCYKRVEHVERAFAEDIGHRRFLPYLALHEFEALLFTDLNRCSVFTPKAVSALQLARNAVSSPEEINDHRETAPSKRILAVMPEYRKRLHGPQAVQEIGLPQLRAACRHFDQWLSRLEALAP
ncbi:DUF4276 family protein [Pyxidicoccus sp. 3LG]